MEELGFNARMHCSCEKKNLEKKIFKKKIFKKKKFSKKKFQKKKFSKKKKISKIIENSSKNILAKNFN